MAERTSSCEHDGPFPHGVRRESAGAAVDGDERAGERGAGAVGNVRLAAQSDGAGDEIGRDPGEGRRAAGKDGRAERHGAEEIGRGRHG